MKKNIIIGILVIIVICLGGYFIYDHFFIEEQQKSEEKQNDVTQNEQTNEDILTDSETKNYIHFTKTELKYTNDSKTGISFEIKNGELVETSSKNFKITGINGNVEYFTYDISCEGLVAMLVITQDKKLYASEFNLSDSDLNGKNLQFKLVETNEKVVDVTRHVNITASTCDANYLAAVLEDGKIYAIKGYNNIGTYTVSNYDYSIYEDAFSRFVIYNDHSIEIITSEINGSKIKYNNTNVIVERIYYISDGQYYILDKNNMLYKLEITTNNYPDDILKNISLVKNSEVASIEHISTNDALDVTYKDGTSETLKVNLNNNYYYINSL